MRVVIQHVAGAREDLLARILAVLPSAEVSVIVDESGNPRETFRRSLVGEAHWHLEDDAILAPDFVDRASYAERILGSDVIQGFSRKKDGLSNYYAASAFSYTVCVYLPAGVGPAIANYVGVWPGRARHRTSAMDLIVRDWLIAMKWRYWLELPSLVQHAPVRQSVSFTRTYGSHAL